MTALFKKQADKRQTLYRKMNFKIFMNGEEIKKKPRKKNKKLFMILMNVYFNCV